MGADQAIAQTQQVEAQDDPAARPDLPAHLGEGMGPAQVL